MSLLIPSGVRAGGPDPQDMAQHPSPVWDTPSSAAGVFWGSGFRLEVSVVLKVGWVCGCLGMIKPGLQHRCGTGWSSCLQQLVCEPGPREVNQPQGRAQGA